MGNLQSSARQGFAPNLQSRFSGIMATGVASGLIASIGDFFTPRGGWALLLVIGFLSLLFAGYVFITSGKGRLLLWVSAKDRDTASWWFGSRHTQHGLHVALLFGIVCLATGFKSYETRAHGGIIAGSIPAVGEMQAIAGIADEIRETRSAVAHLSEIVKRETSDDPRKELSNLGISWTESSANEAIQNLDLNAVALFVQGGFPLLDRPALKIRIASLFNSDNWPKSKALAEFLDASGVDVIADWRDHKSWRGSPLGQALSSRSGEAMEWILQHGDTQSLHYYVWVPQRLASSSGYCADDDDLFNMVRRLGDAGYPLASAHATYQSAYKGWFARRHNLDFSAEDPEKRTQIAHCQRVMDLLEPDEVATTNALQLAAAGEAKAGSLAELEHELSCIERSLTRKISEGVLIPRMNPPKPDEEVFYSCQGRDHYDLGSYGMVKAATLQRKKDAIVQDIERLHSLR